MLIVDMIDNFALAIRNGISFGIIQAFAENSDKKSAGTFDAGSMINGETSEAFGNLNNNIQSAGNGMVYIMMMLIGFIGVIGLGIAAIKVMVGGAATKSEAKGSLFWILIALIVGFGAIAIVGTLQTVGNCLFNTAAAKK